MVKETSFVKVGSLLGVSDNGLRKYLAHFGVNVKEIKK